MPDRRQFIDVEAGQFVNGCDDVSDFQRAYAEQREVIAQERRSPR